jgi:hypothetical protein
MTTSSILSFPDRGHYGDSRYRGNCSGHVIREMLEYFKPRVFTDPSCGGDSSGSVVAEMRKKGSQIEYFGLDLHSGFNILKDSLTERIGGSRCDYLFYHPAYMDIVKYSGSQWGTEAHPDDLSNCVDYEDFLTKLSISLQNIYECLKGNAYFSVLIGDVRRQGNYYSIQSDILQIAPGKLDGILIKKQHNCVSDKKTYSGRFIPISHEYLINFRKDKLVFGMLDASLEISRKLEMLSRANWSATIKTALNRLGGQANLTDLYAAIEATAPDKVKPRKNWKARIRCELQRHFRPLERGVWANA